MGVPVMKRTPLARRLRRNMTDAERLLWSRLRNHQMRGLKFRRQLTIEGYIADFACIGARLVVELDGGQHTETVRADAERTAKIEAAGYIVLRFWNDDVIANVDTVLDEIDRAVATRV